MYRMIVTDLDSTLLTDDKRITENSQRVIRKCQIQGIRIVFATARPWRAVYPYLKDIPCDAIIYHNGTTVQAKGEILGSPHRIPVSRVQEILANIQRDFPAKKLSVEMNDTLYANFPVATYWSYTDGITTDFSDLPAGKADKVIAEISSMEEFQQIQSHLTEAEYGQICERQLCLMMHRNASKLNGIHSLCRHWQMSLDEVIAFGDDHNDLEMIRACGTGVAMANGIPEVHQAADHVTLSNNEEGVADWIQKKVWPEILHR
jgi:5-amino-6-(5-phospho-D-ribitylamino)uracil phosphatase